MTHELRTTALNYDKQDFVWSSRYTADTHVYPHHMLLGWLSELLATILNSDHIVPIVKYFNYYTCYSFNHSKHLK